MSAVTAMRDVRDSQVVGREIVRHIHHYVSPHLREVVDELRRRDPVLGCILGYHLGFNDKDDHPEGGDSGGIGGTLCLAALGADAVGCSDEEVIACAVALELAKDFTQLEDDIIDHDQWRRERGSAWCVFGIPLTLLAADATKGLALEELRRFGPQGSVAMQRIAAMLDTSTLGQAHDLRAASRPLIGPDAVSLDECRMIAEKKAAALVSLALSLGAILANSPETLMMQIAHAGRHIGLAWQVLDDALDIWGVPGSHSGVLGYNDLREGKRSFPIVAALHSDHADRGALLKLMAKGLKSGAELTEAANLIARIGGLDASQREIRNHFNEAMRMLDEMPILDRAKEALIALVPLIGLRGANKTVTIANPAFELAKEA